MEASVWYPRRANSWVQARHELDGRGECVLTRRVLSRTSIAGLFSMRFLLLRSFVSLGREEGAFFFSFGGTRNISGWVGDSCRSFLAIL